MAKQNDIFAFNSLSSPVDRIKQADFFLQKIPYCFGFEFRCHLNAFLTLARSVTFLLQSEMKQVPEFNEWYAKQQEDMRNDKSMKFFIELRNFTEKQGQVFYISSPAFDDGKTEHRFVNSMKTIPETLWDRDIVCCCKEYLSKLAGLLLDFHVTYPERSCIKSAISEKGQKKLGYTLSDLEIHFGYPENYLRVGSDSLMEAIKYFNKQVDAIDIESLSRIAGYKPLILSKNNFINHLARNLSNSTNESFDIVTRSTIIERIASIEKGKK